MSKGIDLPTSKIAFVQSCWHRDIVDRSRDSFLKNIEPLGFQRSQVDLYEVPGVFEIPLHAKLLAGALDVLQRCQCDAGCPACVGPIGEVGETGKQATLRLLRELNREFAADQRTNS